MPSSFVPSSVLGTTIEPSEMTLGTGVGTGILSRPIFATRAAAAATTTLVVTDASTQEITTGSATHIFKTPVVTTLVAGWATLFVNVSTATVTLNSSGNNLIATLAPGQSVTLKCRSISADTTAAAWDVVGKSPQVLTGSAALPVSASPILAGTTQEIQITVTGAVAGDFPDIVFSTYQDGAAPATIADIFCTTNLVRVTLAANSAEDAYWGAGATLSARITRY